MDQPQATVDPMPPRVGLFTVWRWKLRWQLAALVVVVLIGYPASIGPAIWLASHGLLSPEAFAIIYAPLEWAPLVKRIALRYMPSWVPFD
jgi:hypothetical protein